MVPFQLVIVLRCVFPDWTVERHTFLLGARYAKATAGRLLHPVASAAAVSRGDHHRDTFHEAGGSQEASQTGLGVDDASVEIEDNILYQQGCLMSRKNA